MHFFLTLSQILDHPNVLPVFLLPTYFLFQLDTKSILSELLAFSLGFRIGFCLFFCLGDSYNHSDSHALTSTYALSLQQASVRAVSHLSVLGMREEPVHTFCIIPHTILSFRCGLLLHLPHSTPSSHFSGLHPSMWIEDPAKGFLKIYSLSEFSTSTTKSGPVVQFIEYLRKPLAQFVQLRIEKYLTVSCQSLPTGDRKKRANIFFLHLFLRKEHRWNGFNEEG